MAKTKQIAAPKKERRAAAGQPTALELVARTPADGLRALRRDIEARVSVEKPDRDAIAAALAALEAQYERVARARRPVVAPAHTPALAGRRGGERGARRAAAPPRSGERKPDVEFLPTPEELVDAMLKLARPAPDDLVYDLGSGDGRIVIAAARKYKCRGVGVDIDEARIEEATARAAEEGVADRVRFVRSDLFDVDLHAATIVTLYLLPDLNKRLRRRLLDQLAPGTRIVSHAFDMGDWTPTEQREVDGRRLYLWIVPEKEIDS